MVHTNVPRDLGERVEVSEQSFEVTSTGSDNKCNVTLECTLLLFWLSVGYRQCMYTSAVFTHCSVSVFTQREESSCGIDE